MKGNSGVPMATGILPPIWMKLLICALNVTFSFQTSTLRGTIHTSYG